MFYLPLSHEAASGLHVLEQWILNLNRDPCIPDVWVWTRKSGDYSAKSFYTIMHSHSPTIQPCKWLWQSRCTMKIKVFGWLLFLTDSTQRICWLEDIGDQVRKIIYASSVMNMCMRTESIYSSIASSAPGYGITWALIGLMALILNGVSSMLGPASDFLSSLKLC